MGDSYRRIEAVRLAISILTYLSGQRGPVPASDVAGALDIPYATVMCHLATLEDAHMARSVGGHYELAMGAALLWAKYKAQTEGKILTLQHDLSSLEVG